MVSQGVPMLLAGDERNRTQQGNNNAYCQDSPLNWVDWADDGLNNNQLTAFVTRLLNLRREFPVLSNSQYIHQSPGSASPGIVWLNSDGQEMQDEHWQDHHGFVLGLMLSSADQEKNIHYLLIIFNNSNEQQDFNLAESYTAHNWLWLLNTELETGIPERTVIPQTTTFKIPHRSVAILSSVTREAKKS
jgi:glycogen operon protein